MTPYRRPVLAAIWRLCAGLGALAAMAVRAETPEARVHFDLPVGDAATRLRQLSEIARREILFAAEAVRGVQTQGLQGEFTALEAANRLLAGTPLAAVQDEKTGALAVRPRSLAARSGLAAPVPAAPAPAPARAAPGLAILHGRVFNQATGEALEGARVAIGDTDRVTHTERGGLFSLPHLPAGNTLVQLSYPGLDPATFTVHLDAGAPTTREFPLTSGIYQLGAYAVTAVREGTAAALARQEQALTLTHAFATDAFGNIAKGDLGTFLQRLPGVAGEYGGSAVDAIYVRGLSPEFTSVSLDGTRAAMANPDSRTQVVSALPSGAIESVEVIKTPTADMDADSLGGVVNLRTRSGFDRTGRTVILNASATTNATLGRHFDPAHGRTYFPGYSAEYADVFRLLGRKLGVSLTGTYQDIGDGLQTVRADFAPLWDYRGPSLPRRVVYADHEFHLNKRADLHLKFDYRLGPDSSVSLAAGLTRHRNFMNQIRPQYVDNVAIDAAQTTTDLWVFSRVRHRTSHVLRHVPNDMRRLQLAGRHRLAGGRLEWEGTWSDSDRRYTYLQASARSAHEFSMTWDRRASREFPALTYTGGVPPPADPFDQIASVGVEATHERSTDRVRAARLDFTRAPASRPLTVKAGLRLRTQDRTRDFDQLTGTLPGGDWRQYRDFSYTHGWVDGRYPATPIWDTNRYFLDAAVRHQPGGQPARPAVPFAWDAALFPASLDTSATNSLLADYRTRETIPAAYLQFTARPVRPLQATAGLRWEETRTRIVSRLENTAGTTPEARYAAFKTVASTYATWFPNLQFRYEPIRHLTLRANFSTTIGRPRMADLVGRFSVNELDQILGFSNPSLLPQESRNYDAGIEYYFEPVGVLSAGVFRKEIANYVTTLTTRLAGHEFGLNLAAYAGWQGVTRVNAGRGTVQGAEFNYSQQLSFLPGALRGLGLMANWTVLTSAGDYHGLVPGLPFRNYLTGLRPRSGNAGLAWVSGRWDLRVMWNHASAYLVSLDAGDPSNSEFIGARQQWDAFARFRLTRPLSVFLDVINLTESHRGRYRGLVHPDRLAQTNLFPRTVTAGVQARF